jgi:hypothetical protein
VDSQPRYRQSATVCVALSVHDDLQGAVFTTMRSEATRIWQPHGIALTWTSPPSATCDTVVPLVFDDAQLRKLAGPKREDALALTVFAGRSRTVYVSAPRAFRMLPGVRESASALLSGGERDLRGGTLIGRVVAHELGHVLLETTLHSETGLMRPVYRASDALSADPQTTSLSRVESQRLAMRFSLEPAGVARTPAILARRDR